MVSIIYSYNHNQRIGVMVEIGAETDFATKSPEVQYLAKELALQATVGLPGKIEEQQYIRNPSQKIKDVIAETSKTMKEEIKVLRCIRWGAGDLGINGDLKC